MSHWILVIFMYTGSRNGGVSSQAIEFTTKERCVIAMSYINKHDDNSYAVCFEK